MWADEQIPATLIANLLAYKYVRPTPVQMQAIPAMLNVSSKIVKFKAKIPSTIGFFLKCFGFSQISIFGKARDTNIDSECFLKFYSPLFGI